LTPRISATAGGYYRYDDYEPGVFFAAPSDQEAFDGSVRLSYEFIPASLPRLITSVLSCNRTMPLALTRVIAISLGSRRASESAEICAISLLSNCLD
jgi:hypothetical protein